MEWEYAVGRHSAAVAMDEDFYLFILTQNSFSKTADELVVHSVVTLEGKTVKGLILKYAKKFNKQTVRGETKTYVLFSEIFFNF